MVVEVDHYVKYNDHNQPKFTEKLKSLYWNLMEWVARRYFYMEVAPWVLPVFGGLLISTNLGSDFSIPWILAGVLAILIGSVPLGLKAHYEEHIQSFDDQADAQERICLRLIAAQLPKIPVSNAVTRTDRGRIREEAVDEVVSKLTQQIYSNIPGIRAVFYALGERGGKEALFPLLVSGRSSAPKEHIEGSDRFESMKELLQSVKETHRESGVENRSYRSYVSASVAHDDDVFGLLTLDTNENLAFSERDELNLQLLARLLASFFAAAERGRHGRQ